MLINSRITVSVLFGLVLLAGSAWAATSTLEGIVKDSNGKLMANADIKIEAKDGGSWNKMVKTNASGRYSYSGLPATGTYRVSLVVNGTVKASINNVKTKPSEPTQLNFDLKKETASSAPASAKKKTHKVWVSGGGTGSNLGGRWIEVEGDEVAPPDVNRVYQVKGSSIHP